MLFFEEDHLSVNFVLHISLEHLRYLGIEQMNSRWKSFDNLEEVLYNSFLLAK